MSKFMKQFGWMIATVLSLASIVGTIEAQQVTCTQSRSSKAVGTVNKGAQFVNGVLKYWYVNTTKDSLAGTCNGFTVQAIHDTVIVIKTDTIVDTVFVKDTVPTPPPVDTTTAPPATGPNSMYFNSAEAGCGTDSNVLLCDDFEDGMWYEKNCDQANASGGLLQTDGWCGTIFNNAGLAAGTGRCGNAGFKSNCAATTQIKGTTPGVSTTTGNMADHDLASGGSDDIYARWYTKPMLGYLFGQEKWLTFNASGVGSGGIRWGNLMWNCGQGGTTGTTTAKPRMHLNVPQDGCWNQNQNNDITMSAGNWYFVEVHYKLNTPGQANGLFELWVDNCGPNGTTCPATPTLRTRLPAVQTDRASLSEKITTLWFEAWAEGPFTTGERLVDQIKVSKVGPIGFMK